MSFDYLKLFLLSHINNQVSFFQSPNKGLRIEVQYEYHDRRGYADADTLEQLLVMLPHVVLMLKAEKAEKLRVALSKAAE